MNVCTVVCKYNPPARESGGCLLSPPGKFLKIKSYKLLRLNLDNFSLTIMVIAKNAHYGILCT